MLRVTINGRETRLEPRSMQLLVYLASQPGRVISRAELEEKVWGTVVGDEALTNSISKLRRIFGDDARAPRFIETLPKTGYRFLAEVVWEDELPGPGEGGVTAPHGKLLWPRLRNTAILLAVFVVLAGAWVLFAGKTTKEPGAGAVVAEKPAVAILPFENLGDRPAQDYFANGITIDLITDLARYPQLLVIAPGSVFSYQGGDPGGPQLSRELDVDYVVRGSVQRQQGRVRINVQLIQATGERALWAVRYEGQLGGMFEFQESVIDGLLSALRVSRLDDRGGLPGQHPVGSPEAYDLFLRGLEAYGRRTRESNQAAKALYQQAIDMAPDFGRAIAGLAEIGDVDEMEWQVDELLSSHPGFSLRMLDYAFPFRDASLRARAMRLLQQAGLPQ